MDAANTFKANVKMKRTMVNDADLNGGTMSGKEAAAKGLVTGLADSLKILLGQLEGTATQGIQAKAFKK
jgi:hypothetical protein